MSIRSKRTLAQKMGEFLRQYGRKKHAGSDPNDRSYDREIEKKLKHMDPVELDELLRGEDGADE